MKIGEETKRSEEDKQEETKQETAQPESPQNEMENNSDAENVPESEMEKENAEALGQVTPNDEVQNVEFSEETETNTFKTEPPASVSNKEFTTNPNQTDSESNHANMPEPISGDALSAESILPANASEELSVPDKQSRFFFRQHQHYFTRTKAQNKFRNRTESSTSDLRRPVPHRRNPHTVHPLQTRKTLPPLRSALLPLRRRRPGSSAGKSIPRIWYTSQEDNAALETTAFCNTAITTSDICSCAAVKTESTSLVFPEATISRNSSWQACSASQALKKARS